MNLPTPPQVNLESFGDVPDWARAAFGVFNRAVRQIYSASQVTPVYADALELQFLTTSGGTGTVLMKNKLKQQPKHLNLTMLRRVDLVALTAAYSYEWAPAESGIELKFVGLPASVKITFSAEYR